MLGAQTSSSLQIRKLRPKNCDPCPRSQNRNKSRPFFTVQWVFTHFATFSVFSRAFAVFTAARDPREGRFYNSPCGVQEVPNMR